VILTKVRYSQTPLEQPNTVQYKLLLRRGVGSLYHGVAPKEAGVVCMVRYKAVTLVTAAAVALHLGSCTALLCSARQFSRSPRHAPTVQGRRRPPGAKPLCSPLLNFFSFSRKADSKKKE
jgi:hypothetical protein